MIESCSFNNTTPQTTLVIGSAKHKIEAFVLPINRMPIWSKATAPTVTSNAIISVKNQAPGVNENAKVCVEIP